MAADESLFYDHTLIYDGMVGYAGEDVIYYVMSSKIFLIKVRFG